MILDHLVGGFAQAGMDVDGERFVHHIAHNQFFVNAIFDKGQETPSADDAEDFSFRVHHQHGPPACLRHRARGGHDGRLAAADEDGVGHHIADGLALRLLLPREAGDEIGNGDDPDRFALLGDKQAADLLFDERAHRFRQGQIRFDGFDRLGHEIGGGQLPHHRQAFRVRGEPFARQKVGVRQDAEGAAAAVGDDQRVDVVLVQ